VVSLSAHPDFIIGTLDDSVFAALSFMARLSLTRTGAVHLDHVVHFPSPFGGGIIPSTYAVKFMMARRYLLEESSSDDCTRACGISYFQAYRG
jgi:hypothetical protein